MPENIMLNILLTTAAIKCRLTSRQKASAHDNMIKTMNYEQNLADTIIFSNKKSGTENDSH